MRVKTTSPLFTKYKPGHIYFCRTWYKTTVLNEISSSPNLFVLEKKKETETLHCQHLQPTSLPFRTTISTKRLIAEE